ncbi:MAG TPA: hypothetical protein VLD65_14035 [Anaerolineales bacterium]|nr:hypothetical protein [Anaerolineales bacterium]
MENTYDGYGIYLAIEKSLNYDSNDLMMPLIRQGYKREFQGSYKA